MSASSSGVAGPTPEEITRASGSNLALAFVVLPRHLRADMNLYYSFCRIVDDIADEPGMDINQRLAALNIWKAALTHPQQGESPLAPAIRDLIQRKQLAVDDFVELILGCEMDIHGTAYETWEDLRLYCHRVASVVGYVSVALFGARDPQACIYAEKLGLALQLTNIIRDVGEDYRKLGRIYLPRADMDQFGYDVGGLAVSREDAAWRGLMEFEAERARKYFAEAREALPQSDRRALVAAEIMRRVYQKLLRKMQRGGLHTLSRRYRLSRWEKLWCVFRGWAAR